MRVCLSPGSLTLSQFPNDSDRFEEWTGDDHLLLNVEKTMEIVIDFRSIKLNVLRELRFFHVYCKMLEIFSQAVKVC